MQEGRNAGQRGYAAGGVGGLLAAEGHVNGSAGKRRRTEAVLEDEEDVEGYEEELDMGLASRPSRRSRP